MNTLVRGRYAATLLPALFGLASLIALTGCAASAGYGYASGGVAYADSDDYVYYPAYEVYYSPVTHVYVYRDHDRWVRRSAPPRNFARGSASVHMNFHDSPEHHHAEVVHSYPQTWRQQPTGHPDDHRADRGKPDDKKHAKDKDHRERDDDKR